jgi:hypothetical protein
VQQNRPSLKHKNLSLKKTSAFNDFLIECSAAYIDSTDLHSVRNKRYKPSDFSIKNFTAGTDKRFKQQPSAQTSRITNTTLFKNKDEEKLPQINFKAPVNI